MNIQTLSVVVPTKGCVNNCKFCVSKMHDNDYNDKHDDEYYYEEDLKRRLKYADKHNVTDVILTGTGECLQNKKFLDILNKILRSLNNPFPNISIQTSGVMLMETFNKNTRSVLKDGNEIVEDIYTNLLYLKEIGVSTISLSVADLDNQSLNFEIMCTPKKLQYNLIELCKQIKKHGFNLRLSLNITKFYDHLKPFEIFDTLKMLKADQVTFRKMYDSGQFTKEDRWVREHAVSEKFYLDLYNYIQTKGEAQYKLPFGAIVTSIDGIGTVIDDNCMGEDDISNIKFLILREDGKLYTHWENKGSLIF